MKIVIRWKKATDEGYPRHRVVEIDTPVTRETTALEDAVLGLPQKIIAQIDGPLESTPTDEQCIEAIEAALLLFRAKEAKAESEARDAAERSCIETVDRAQKFLLEDGFDHNVWADLPSSLWPEGSQLYRIDPDLARQVKAEHDRRTAAEEEAQAQRREKNEAAAKRKAAEKQKNQEARTSEKLAWIEQHGSPRLLLQVEAGLDGWPLYLHERLAADLPEGLDDYGGDQWELDNDGVNGDTLVNPSRQAVEMLIKSAARLVELKLEPDRKAALANLTIRRIEFPSDDDPDGYGCDETEVPSGIYLVYSSYRPGQHPGWSSKSIRIVVNQ